MAGGGIYSSGNSFLIVTKTIIAYGLHGGAVEHDGSRTPNINCCDIYGNAGGDWPLATLLAQDVPQGWGGEVKRLRQVPGVRTTAILERLLEKPKRSTRRPAR